MRVFYKKQEPLTLREHMGSLRCSWWFSCCPSFQFSVLFFFCCCCLPSFCVLCPLQYVSLDCPLLIAPFFLTSIHIRDEFSFAYSTFPFFRSIISRLFLNLLNLHFSPGFQWGRVTRSLILCVCFVDRCLSFCPFSFGHCVVCLTSIYGF